MESKERKLNNFENETEADERKEHIQVTLYQNVPKFSRTDSIKSTGYYRWRKGLWDAVNRYLRRRDTSGLNSFYCNHFQNWESRAKYDLALMTLGRQAITAFFNLGIKQSLKINKRARKILDTFPSFDNRQFVEAEVYIISALLYTEKGKLGEAEKWIALAQQLLENSESSEFTANLRYVIAKYYVRFCANLSKEKTVQKHVRNLAFENARISREACGEESAKGEWFALYTVESLFLMLRIRLNADNFPEEKDLEQPSEEILWDMSKLTETHNLINQVEEECSMLKYNYIYVTLGLKKCRCILNIKYMQMYNHRNSITDALKSYKDAESIAEQSISVCTEILKKDGFIMANYVEKTSDQFKKIQEMLQSCYRVLKVKLRSTTGATRSHHCMENTPGQNLSKTDSDEEFSDFGRSIEDSCDSEVL